MLRDKLRIVPAAPLLALWCVGGAAIVLREPPQWMARGPAERAAADGLKEIEAAVDAAVQQQTDSVHAALQSVTEDFNKSVASELTGTQEAVRAEKAREASTVWVFRNTIFEAHQKAVAEVHRAAVDWARSRAGEDILKAEGEELGRAAQELAAAEEARGNATVEGELAASTAEQMLELATEAEDVSKQLHEAHAEEHARNAEERNRLAESQARQSYRLSQMAGRLTYESSLLAEHALHLAEGAEAKARQALDTARANAVRLEQIKAAAQRTLRRSAGDRSARAR